ncbi:MAG: hypothetical protein AB8F78_01630 [Saprospiraceae bacterium]
MGIWKALFGRKEKNVEKAKEPVPHNFRELAKKAITLIGNDTTNMDNEEVYDYMISKGIPEFEAEEILLFLPTAFCRKMLPELDWSPHYFDSFSNGEKTELRFEDNARFQLLQEETETIWDSISDDNFTLNIVGRSSEFNAINKLLQDGGSLTDITVVSMHVNR